MKTQQTAIISLFLCVIIVFWCSHAVGEDWTAEQKEVWAAVKAHSEAIKNGDVKTALAGQHEKMLAWFSVNPDPLKKELIQVEYKNWVGRFKPAFFKLEPLAINIVQNVANVFYLYKWESANKEYSGRSRVLETFIRQDNKWLATGSLFSSCDKPAPCPYGW